MPMHLDRALRDLEERTLDVFSSELSKLLYLASTRDYTTGRYSHDGLAIRFTHDIAEAALQTAHRRRFENLASASLERVVSAVDQFIEDTHADRATVLTTWRKIEPYRIAIPLEIDTVVAQLFI